MTALTLPAPPTANQRLKDRFGMELALSIMAAAGLHALLFALWPSMTAASWATPGPTTTTVVQVATTELPKAPKPLSVPALPVPSATVTADATLGIIHFDDVPDLPPPPTNPGNQVGDAADGTWAGPVTVAPSLVDTDALRAALLRVYPSILRQAGIGGTVGLLVRIDARGRVLESKIDRSSGYKALDEAALKVSSGLRFHPAMNRDTPVSVWVELPVTFQSGGGGAPVPQPMAQR